MEHAKKTMKPSRCKTSSVHESSCRPKKITLALIPAILVLVCALPVTKQQAWAEDGPSALVYDTGLSSSAPLSRGAVLKRTGWTRVTQDAADHAFKGDVVLANDRLAVVLRRDGNAAEVYASEADGQGTTAAVKPSSGEGAAPKLSRAAIVQNGEDAVVVDAFFGSDTDPSLGLRLELAMGQAFVKTEPLDKTVAVCVEAPCRFAVLPDFFADDIVVDAAEIPVKQARLPSENFLLHMLDGGNAILMAVWENRGQEVIVNLEGAPPNRMIQSSVITHGAQGKIWLAVLADRGIWHVRDIAARDRGRKLRLEWRRPYPGLWRVDWRRTDKLTESWEMLTQLPDGAYKKHGLFSEDEDAWTAQDWYWGESRKRYNTELGSFMFPCWFDLQGQGYLQPLKKKLLFEGPAIIYPLNRLMATPLDKLTVVDVVRSTLGVGPCQYILDVEGHQEAFQGKPTCAVRDLLNPIYEKGEHKTRQTEVNQALDDVLAFITLIRKRIDQYQAFGKEMQAFLLQEKAGPPDLTDFLTEMETLTKKIDEAIARRKARIKSVEFASALVDDFRQTLLDYEGKDSGARCAAFTKQWVEIGGNQDELVAECRAVVKNMRQRAAIAAAMDPRLAEVGSEIRLRSQAILRQPVNYESPHH